MERRREVNDRTTDALSVTHPALREFQQHQRDKSKQTGRKKANKCADLEIIGPNPGLDDEGRARHAGYYSYKIKGF